MTDTFSLPSDSETREEFFKLQPIGDYADWIKNAVLLFNQGYAALVTQSDQWRLLTEEEQDLEGWQAAVGGFLEVVHQRHNPGLPASMTALVCDELNDNMGANTVASRVLERDVSGDVVLMRKAVFDLLDSVEGVEEELEDEEELEGYDEDDHTYEQGVLAR